MKYLFSKAVVASLTTLLVVFAGPATADDVGYWTSSSDSVWVNSFGECWQAPASQTAATIEQCGEQKAEPEPEPKPEKSGPLDSDGDGVPDSRDWCAGTEAGVQVDKRGCALDSDGDGVADYQDECPNTANNVRVDDKGCPLEGTKLFTLKGVNFAFDSAKLRPEAETQLQQAVRKLRDNQSVGVGIIGYTDSVGPASYNQDLSLRRARSVVNYLTNNGIDASRLEIRGRGESNPVATNETKAGRAQNRRVEFIVQ